MSRNLTGSQTNAQTGWFLLFDENYEGPITLQDLQSRLESAAIPRDTLLWQAGRETWEPVSHFPEFRSYVEQLPIVAPRMKPAAAIAAPLTHVDSRKNANVLSRKEIKAAVRATPTATNFERSNEMAWSNFTERQGFVLGNAGDLAKAQTPSRQKTIALASLVGTLLVGVSTYFALRTPMPPLLAQLEAGDREQLHSTLASRGPNTAAIAMLNRDLFAPVFVVSTNVPATTPLALKIEGVEETLVGEFRVSMRANLVFKDGVATTPPFRRDNGSPYPHGSYKVSVWSQPSNAPSVLLSEKVFWLNPKSADYVAQIATYHEKLRAQAHDELNELEQVSKTLAAQLDETAGEFEFFLKKPVAKNWTQFSARWTKLQSQLDSLFARSTPEALDSAYYYATTYKALKAIGSMTSALHKAQTEFAAAPTQDRELVVSAQASKLRASLTSIQNKISKTQVLPALASGMPAKLD